MLNWITEHALQLAGGATIAELTVISISRKSSLDLREQLTSAGCIGLAYITDHFFNGGLAFQYVMTQLTAGIESGASHTLASWIICLLAVDLQAYLWHRASHAFRPLWALHHVHHQSRQMTLIAALRQPAIGFFLPWLQLLPLALLGFPVEIAFSCLMAHRLWDFMLHVHSSPRLGLIEKLLITPAHHRIHHSTDKAYYQSNMGTILTVWDRIGGTYLAPHQVTALDSLELGTEVPVSELNPISANLKPVFRLFQSSRGMTEMKNRIWKKAAILGLMFAFTAGVSARVAIAGGAAWTFSSSTTAADTQTFATITSVKHDVGLDGNGEVEVISIAGTNSSGSAIRASITLPTDPPTSALLATMKSAKMNAARSCEKQAILFKTGLSGSTSFVMRSYTSIGSCPTELCYNLNSSNTVISCSLE